MGQILEILIFTGWELWHRPRRTIALLFATAFLFGLSLFLIGMDVGKASNSAQIDGHYAEQIDSLNGIQDSLKNLSQFIENEKKNMREAEEIVSKLKTEKDQLEPVVNANRRVVEAILKVQSDREQANVWWERGIGFVIGVVSSLVATGIGPLIVVAYRRLRRTPNPTEPPTAPPVDTQP